MTIVSDIPCERCGARVPWNGQTQSVTCSYCQATTRVLLAPKVARPPAGGAGGRAGAAWLVAGAGVLVIGVGAGLWLSSAHSAPPPAPSLTLPDIPAPTKVADPASSAPAGSDIATQILEFGEEGTGPGQTSDARSIAVDLDENVYLADYSTGRVQKLDPTGKFQWIIEVPKNSFSGDKNIWSLVCDTKGTLWVARTGDLLQYSTTDGKPKGTIKGDYDRSWFRYLAIDPVGNRVAEHSAAGNAALLFMDANGKIKRRLKHFETAGLAIDGSGSVYVDSSYDGTIEVLDPTGATKAKFGSKRDTHTSSPGALAVDGKGHVFVDTTEGVNVFDSGGAYIGTLPGVHAARDLEVSVKGNVFVLDNEEKVRKYAPGSKLE